MRQAVLPVCAVGRVHLSFLQRSVRVAAVPQGRPKIAQHFSAGLAAGELASPGRDERGGTAHGFFRPCRDLVRYRRGPSTEVLGYCLSPAGLARGTRSCAKTEMRPRFGGCGSGWRWNPGEIARNSEVGRERTQRTQRERGALAWRRRRDREMRGRKCAGEIGLGLGTRKGTKVWFTEKNWLADMDSNHD